MTICLSHYPGRVSLVKVKAAMGSIESVTVFSWCNPCNCLARVLSFSTSPFDSALFDLIMLRSIFSAMISGNQTYSAPMTISPTFRH